MKYLEYLYYKFIKFQERVGNASIAPFTAMIFLVFISVLYFFSFLTTIYIIFPSLKININPLNIAIILPTILIILYYFILLYDSKYKKIIIKYNTRDTSNIYAWIFVILAFVLINIMLFLKMLQNQGKLF